MILKQQSLSKRNDWILALPGPLKSNFFLVATAQSVHRAQGTGKTHGQKADYRLPGFGLVCVGRGYECGDMNLTACGFKCQMYHNLESPKKAVSIKGLSRTDWPEGREFWQEMQLWKNWYNVQRHVQWRLPDWWLGRPTQNETTPIPGAGPELQRKLAGTKEASKGPYVCTPCSWVQTRCSALLLGLSHDRTVGQKNNPFPPRLLFTRIL